MTHKTIITDNYILITSDDEIKPNDWFLTDDKRVEKSAPDWSAREWHKKVVAHLPLNNTPRLEGVPLLPPLPSGEDYVEKLFDEYEFSDDELIQSLSQPKMPIGFNIEYNEINWGGTIERKEPKIINGVMQGEWIY